jgi:hypothetical protein
MPHIRRWDGETALVAWLAACVSILFFLYYFRRGDLLLYGDAVAHINIARRVFDSRTPGLLQLGTVWLPLPHLLMIPFVLSDWMWRSGVGGAIPSMAAYVLGTVGIFRLVRGILEGGESHDGAARIAAWGAAVVYAANPNLIYLQTTAMTEPLYLALFMWAAVHFAESIAAEAGKVDREAASSLGKCGLCLLGACLTRYDGWFLAAVMGLVVLAMAVKTKVREPALYRQVAYFVGIAIFAPALWLGYNAIIYRNPLEFANGPYSARAIEQKTSVAGAPLHPGTGSLRVAASYFLKSAELNVAQGSLQKLWIVLLFAGCVIVPLVKWRLAPVLLLLAPLPFYALSLAYGSVPIFLPVWWPFSYYNTRYGLELLPAFAVSAALAPYFGLRLTRDTRIRIAVIGAATIFVATSYASIWHDPVCVHEARTNSRTRVALETEVAAYLTALPPDSTLFMYLGDHVGALQRAGIPLRRVINEGNHRVWMQPIDRDGLWERALVHPKQYAEFVIAFDGDPIARATSVQDLYTLAVIHVSGQPQATIYRTGRAAR